MANIINIPGKTIFYGSYSVLLKGHVSLVFAVVDEYGKGVEVKWEEKEERIISKQFNLDLIPSINDKQLVNYAYLTAKTYLNMFNKWKPITLTLTNSPLFGNPGEKSGLGSSAAATVGIIKALFLANDLDPELHVETIFKLSQLSYGWYSGKIGSAFDIAVSSIGTTIEYYRYNPDMLNLPKENNLESLREAIKNSIFKPWDWIKIKRLKPNVDLLLFNIKYKSTSSISAVKAWKTWKKERTEEFEQLMNEQDKYERAAIAALKENNFIKVRTYTRKAREVHRRMQKSISEIVPSFEYVEPDELKELIDNVEENVDGVIAGRCPGAGGYDAVAFLVKKQSNEMVKQILDLGKDIDLNISYLPSKII